MWKRKEEWAKEGYTWNAPDRDAKPPRHGPCGCCPKKYEIHTNLCNVGWGSAFLGAEDACLCLRGEDEVKEQRAIALFAADNPDFSDPRQKFIGSPAEVRERYRGLAENRT
jgi:hypothetical protein